MRACRNRTLVRAARWLAVIPLLLATAAASAAEVAPTRAESIELELADGHRIRADLRVPVDASGPHPVVLLYGGLEGTDHILSVIRSHRPAILASFSYPYDRPGKVRWWQAKSVIDDFGVAVDRTFAGIAALTAALRQRPDVDPNRITIVGASAGAPFATISAQRLDLAGLVVVQGFADMPGVFARLLHDAWHEGPDWLRGPVSQLIGHAFVCYLGLPEPAEYAERLTQEQRVLMITATEDHRIPAESTEALWQALQRSAAQTQRLDLEGGHLRGIGDPAIADIMRRATGWMQAQGLL